MPPTECGFTTDTYGARAGRAWRYNPIPDLTNENSGPREMTWLL